MPFAEVYSQDEPSRAEVDRWRGPVVVEFGAPWCPHCQAIQPALASALAEHAEIRHLKIEDGKGKPLGRSFVVRLWPNLVLMLEGRVLEQLARPTPAEITRAVRALAAAAK